MTSKIYRINDTTDERINTILKYYRMNKKSHLVVYQHRYYVSSIYKIFKVKTKKWLFSQYIKPIQNPVISKVEHFAKIVSDINLLIVFEKSFILGVWQGSKYNCVQNL